QPNTSSSLGSIASKSWRRGCGSDGPDGGGVPRFRRGTDPDAGRRERLGPRGSLVGRVEPHGRGPRGRQERVRSGRAGARATGSEGAEDTGAPRGPCWGGPASVRFGDRRDAYAEIVGPREGRTGRRHAGRVPESDRSPPRDDGTMRRGPRDRGSRSEEGEPRGHDGRGGGDPPRGGGDPRREPELHDQPRLDPRRGLSDPSGGTRRGPPETSRRDRTRGDDRRHGPPLTRRPGTPR